ncbi:hypothetical protein APASM_3606 [Actinosynnema pretiosum subsp. pretiosum]|nr:hypothetical protein APASM_3606 [Actinosynnema pretiosum subsp. pretiosum]
MPPSAKKSASAATAATPSTSPNNPHSTRSRSLRGGRPSLTSAPTSGRALRSSLPLVVRGSASSTTNTEGIMCSGRRSRRWARRAAGSGMASEAAVPAAVRPGAGALSAGALSAAVPGVAAVLDAVVLDAGVSGVAVPCAVSACTR